MFIAMNRFRVLRGREEEFETVWRARESRLPGEPGFEQFTLLKGPEREDHTLYSSHTIWKDRDSFVAWTKSEAFRIAHARGSETKGLYIGGPEFEGFEAVPGLLINAEKVPA